MTLPIEENELSEEFIEEVLLCSRYNELDELEEMLKNFDFTKNFLQLKSKSNNSTPLHFAAANGNNSILNFFLKHLSINHLKIAGDNLETSDYGNTPLHFASLNGNLESLKILLQFGFDPKVKNNLGKTCSTLAEQQGHHDCVNLILKHWDDEDEDEKNLDIRNEEELEKQRNLLV
ncbi:hypothetical protein HK099_008246 [Clydaea vesicula]|uniref:Ankyrin repeat protein n=1 Tax=Clydaea vesicula TaxID=447962 RepID=A0AAD5U7Y3_9FUNG|nr:hypothetical protein HK099_008246 [Clydaea vesicula]KAJ3392560.1 hypothetical protein HDU92_008319 [Lobulomyces angularis]